MKNNSKALYNFMKAGIGAAFLIMLVNKVIEALTNNDNFPGIDKVLKPLADQFKKYMDAWNEGEKGSAVQRREAKQMKPLVQECLKAVCIEVNLLSRGI